MYCQKMNWNQMNKQELQKNVKSMIKSLIFSQFQLLLFSFVLITSCNGQSKSDLPNDRIGKPEINLPDVDPYFAESKALRLPHIQPTPNGDIEIMLVLRRVLERNS